MPNIYAPTDPDMMPDALLQLYERGKRAGGFEVDAELRREIDRLRAKVEAWKKWGKLVSRQVDERPEDAVAREKAWAEIESIDPEGAKS